ncbi:uncharacterized protein LOC124646078 isoform X2 [Helicoverpa zea]|uniref:uncharacterized protein LOC124646078 isoform X2 n=1 Tax=Helicoverpa zea TaxID=7113 RepID=UPI001F56F194|nr:uncharacterized protein LOC124646078 isoform X2 [Helicoverpa zea]
MPPKSKSEAPKKSAPPVIRPPISDHSLMYVPQDVLKGFQERVETGIDWTLIESGARHHREHCKRDDIPKNTFTQALQSKFDKCIIQGFLDENSGLSIEQHWEFLMPAVVWDNQRFATDEGKICFHNANCITDDMMKVIKRAVKANDRNVLKHDMKMVNVLRVNDSKMTELDEGLKKYKKLVSLSLCGNFISDINSDFIPPSVKTLELQANCLKDVSGFAETLPSELLYLGLARNFLTSSSVDGLRLLPYNLTVLDLSDNDIYHLDPVLDAIAKLPNLTALQLSGNPCSVCAGYARATLMRLTRLHYLDCREILPTDRPLEHIEMHPDDLRAAYFYFTVYRIMSAPQPPKAEKGANATFHIELEIPLLDAVRRRFLMFRQNESLIEMLPPPEDDEWPIANSVPAMSKVLTRLDEESSHESDIFSNLVMRNPREIHNYTTFESNKVQWSKLMNFQEPILKIFCPDLVALRDTFRSVITIRLVYSVIYAHQKPAKAEKVKSVSAMKPQGEMRLTIATIRCSLRAPDWSQPSQHFHWDETLGTNDAIHWGEGDLSILQYSQQPVKVTKGKPEGPESGRQVMPDFLTCHFGFGIDTLSTSNIR